MYIFFITLVFHDFQRKELFPTIQNYVIFAQICLNCSKSQKKQFTLCCLTQFPAKLDLLLFFNSFFSL